VALADDLVGFKGFGYADAQDLFHLARRQALKNGYFLNYLYQFFIGWNLHRPILCDRGYSNVASKGDGQDQHINKETYKNYHGAVNLYCQYNKNGRNNQNALPDYTLFSLFDIASFLT
jgi:hypothetical protein